MTTMSFRVRSGSVLSLRRRPCAMGLVMMLFAAWCVLSPPARAADAQILWQIGQADNNNAEFALAPQRYAEFRDDGFFVVGQSDAQRDWPYVHPGPVDGWAGGRPHAFTVIFGLKAVPAAGECRLQCDLLDTQRSAPPELRISVNGQEFAKSLPGGAGDASIFGQPSAGREHRFEVVFPASLLRRRERIDDHHAQRQLVVVRLPVTRDPAGPGNRSGQRYAREFRAVSPGARGT